MAESSRPEQVIEVKDGQIRISTKTGLSNQDDVFDLGKECEIETNRVKHKVIQNESRRCYPRIRYPVTWPFTFMRMQRTMNYQFLHLVKWWNSMTVKHGKTISKNCRSKKTFCEKCKTGDTCLQQVHSRPNLNRGIYNCWNSTGAGLVLSPFMVNRQYKTSWIGGKIGDCKL